MARGPGAVLLRAVGARERGARCRDPEEGGAYAWVRTAFGRFAGAITSILYWAGTPMWLGGSVTVVAIAVVERFLGGLGSAGAYAFGSGSCWPRRSSR